MADNNNKISIDVEINASGQQQINQYKGAFDGLRTSYKQFIITYIKTGW